LQAVNEHGGLDQLLLAEEPLEVHNLPDGQHKQRNHGDDAEQQQAVVGRLCGRGIMTGLHDKSSSHQTVRVAVLLLKLLHACKVGDNRFREILQLTKLQFKGLKLLCLCNLTTTLK
jgi:hypothetical protein